MTNHTPDPKSGDVRLRDVTESDLPILFEQQLDPEANQMAAFPANAASIRVLEKCGFTICDEDKGDSSSGGDEVEEVVLALAATWL